MENPISVMLADFSEEYLHALAERVEKESDMRVVGLTQGGDELVELVKKACPDVLVTDVLLKSLDGIGALKQLRELRNMPSTIVVSSFINDGVLVELNDLGIEYCFLKPCSMEELVSRIRRNSECKCRLNSDGCEELISEALVSCGIMPHLRGFRYLREAIKRSIFDQEALRGITKILYPDLAKDFNTNAKSIERSMRNALDTAWRRGDSLRRRQYFGERAAQLDVRPTNSAFIGFMANFVSGKIEEKKKETAGIF